MEKISLTKILHLTNKEILQTSANEIFTLKGFEGIYFHFNKDTILTVDDKEINFKAGEYGRFFLNNQGETEVAIESKDNIVENVKEYGIYNWRASKVDAIINEVYKIEINSDTLTKSYDRFCELRNLYKEIKPFSTLSLQDRPFERTGKIIDKEFIITRTFNDKIIEFTGLASSLGISLFEDGHIEHEKDLSKAIDNNDNNDNNDNIVDAGNVDDCE